jgi:hypothetical protein
MRVSFAVSEPFVLPRMCPTGFVIESPAGIRDLVVRPSVLRFREATARRRFLTCPVLQTGDGVKGAPQGRPAGTGAQRRPLTPAAVCGTHRRQPTGVAGALPQGVQLSGKDSDSPGSRRMWAAWTGGGTSGLAFVYSNGCS